MEYSKIIIYVLAMAMGVMLYVLLQSYMVTLDTSAWTFMGHYEASLLLQITPILFLITLILVPAYFIVQEAR